MNWSLMRLLQWACVWDIYSWQKQMLDWSQLQGAVLSLLVLWLRCWECPLETGEVITWWRKWTMFCFFKNGSWCCFTHAPWNCIESLSFCTLEHGRQPHPRMATPAQQPSPSNARPLPQEESGGLCCSHTMHFLEGNQLFPHLFSNSLAHLCELCVLLTS